MFVLGKTRLQLLATGNVFMNSKGTFYLKRQWNFDSTFPI